MPNRKKNNLKYKYECKYAFLTLVGNAGLDITDILNFLRISLRTLIIVKYVQKGVEKTISYPKDFNCPLNEFPVIV